MKNFRFRVKVRAEKKVVDGWPFDKAVANVTAASFDEAKVFFINEGIVETDTLDEWAFCGVINHKGTAQSFPVTGEPGDFIVNANPDGSGNIRVYFEKRAWGAFLFGGEVIKMSPQEFYEWVDEDSIDGVPINQRYVGEVRFTGS